MLKPTADDIALAFFLYGEAQIRADADYEPTNGVPADPDRRAKRDQLRAPPSYFLPSPVPLSTPTPATACAVELTVGENSATAHILKPMAIEWHLSPLP